MSYLIDISTAVPEFEITQDDMYRFYVQSLPLTVNENFLWKLNLLCQKSGIKKRYSCIPDFNLKAFELYTENNYRSRVEQRMKKYAEKVLPLAIRANDQLIESTGLRKEEITHLIVVSCTGMLAPGFELLLAEKYQLQHTEKIAINFMGCYAAVKALKQAKYITSAEPEACVLVVCAELCSLHYAPPVTDEDVISTLLFGDGAASALICGQSHRLVQNNITLQFTGIGSACIPGTADLMTWDIGSYSFKMFLSKEIAEAIGNHINYVVTNFLKNKEETDYWAIHPGGIKIIQEVKKQLQLDDSQIKDSYDILENYGNMSSPTILFVLKHVLEDIKKNNDGNQKKIFACAFGPGISVEMLSFISSTTTISQPGLAVSPDAT